jgi:DNA mismatch endonuclease (patch repair protein)
VTDVVDKQTRSRMMSGIRGKDTKPELLIRSALHRAGYRFRLHSRDLPGRPDIVLPKYHAVIFVHGCFWHMHQCSLFKWPKSRTEFWREKLNKNRQRDTRLAEQLSDAGWRRLVVWECALKGREKLGIDRVRDLISAWLKGGEASAEISGESS